MKLALDAAAGDFGLVPNIDGACRAAAQGLELLLVGPARDLGEHLRRKGISESDPRFELVDAPELVSMSEEPAAACRLKPRASIMVCAQLVASGRAAGLVSAGNSGAAMAASLWHLKRIDGVLRPAVAAVLPTPRGPVVLLDAGANVDCKPWHLAQFAAMGSVYAQDALGKDQPRIGLLSIGEEFSKGNMLVKEAVPLLESSGLAFHGMVEGRDIPAGTVDVIVCDGFVGNVAVKLMEGMGAAVASLFKAEVATGWLYGAAAALLRGPLERVKRRLNYDEYGGAPLLGVAGNAVIAHGRSNGKAIANALGMAARLSERGSQERIRRAVDDLKHQLEKF